MNNHPLTRGSGRRYFEAVALGNGRPGRFIPLVRNLKGGFIVLHFFLIALALNFPVMFAIARLEPWDFYSRLYGSRFAETLPAEMGAGPEPFAETLVEPDIAADFNGAMYSGGYGRRVMLPMLAFVFMLVLILQAVFYGCAAFFLGLARMTSSPLAYRDRLGILVFSSTLPAAASALLGLWLPTVHLVVFYLAEIILAFTLARPRGEP